MVLVFREVEVLRVGIFDFLHVFCIVYLERERERGGEHKVI